MNIVLIYPSPNIKAGESGFKTPPLGLGYLASVLTSETEHNVEIFDQRVSKKDKKSLLEWGDVFGVYTNIKVARAALMISKEIKNQSMSNKVVLGGPWASSVKEVVKKTYVDYVVSGEGEYVFKELCEKLAKNKDFDDISGVYHLSEGEIKGETKDSFEKIGNLPLPAHNLFELNQYSIRGHESPVGVILTSRGCPYHCSYCTKCIFGYAFRKRRPKNVLNEMKYLYDSFGVQDFFVLDDNFAIDRERAFKIFNMIINSGMDISLNFLNGFHINTVDKELLKRLKKAGGEEIAFGFESGSKRVLENINKYYSFKKARKVVKDAKDLGFKTKGYFMLGLPGDNEESISKTLRFARYLDPHFVSYSVTLPFPGTELWEEIEDKGEISDDIKYGFNEGYHTDKVVYSLKNTDGGLIRKYRRLGYLHFYFRPLKIFELLSFKRGRTEIDYFFKRRLNELFNKLKRIFELIFE